MEAVPKFGANQAPLSGAIDLQDKGRARHIDGATRVARGKKRTLQVKRALWRTVCLQDGSGSSRGPTENSTASLLCHGKR